MDKFDTPNMASHQTKPMFFTALFKGIVTIAGITTSCLFALQILYGLGWFLYSVIPRHEARTVAIFGMELDFAADRSAPTTAWLFAADSQPNLVGAGILILIVATFVALLVFGVAWMGGWRNPRMEPLRQWMNT